MIGDDRMVGPLGVVASPFRPTSRIEGRGPHHYVGGGETLVQFNNGRLLFLSGCHQSSYFIQS